MVTVRAAMGWVASSEAVFFGRVVFSATGDSWNIATGMLFGIVVCVVLSNEVMALVILLLEGSKVLCLLGCHPNLSLGA